MTCSRRREDFAIEVWEGVRERVTALMSTRRGGWVDVHVVLDEELLEHLPGGDEEVTIAPLTPELERAFSGHLRDGAVRDGCPDVGRDDDLQVALHTFGEANKVRRRAYSREVGVWGYGHVGFERNMILEQCQTTLRRDGPNGRTKSMVAAIWT